MNFKNQIIFSNKGVAFIVALLILLTISILGIVILITSNIDSKVTGNLRTGTEAFYLAEAGIQRALRQINYNVSSTPLYYNDAGHLGTIFSDQSLGSGTYSVTIAADGTDSSGNKILSVTSTGTISSTNALKKVNVRIIPQYTNTNLFKYAAFGQNGITFSGNNAMTDSYDSALGDYGGSNKGANGDIGSNTTSNAGVSLSNSNIYGDIAIGSGGNTSTVITQGPNAAVSGSKSALSANEVFPDVTIPSGTGPGTALSISGNNTVNLSSGTYYYTSISISGSGKLNINGDVTIYVSGSVDASGNGIVNTTSNPANFHLKVSGTSSVSIKGNGGFYGGVYAPNAPVTINGNGALYGSVVGSTVNFTGNAQLHYDEALETLGGGNVLSSYKISAWKEVTS